MSISELQEELRIYVENAKRAAHFIRKELRENPKIAIILGSGLGDISKSLDKAVTVAYEEIPGFPVSTAPGHKGTLEFGKVLHHDVMLMNGRLHFYEGYSMRSITFPIRVMQELGIEVLIITNASGGLNPDFEVGRIMLIKDIINFMGDNPLIGPNVDEWGPRFPDMSEPFDTELLEKTKQAAKEIGIGLYDGIYVGVAGPNFETPAELRMLRRFGADAVGMSTVPEVIAARHAGIKVLGMAAISDKAVPDDLKPLTAEEVIEAAGKTGKDISRLILKTLGKI